MMLNEYSGSPPPRISSRPGTPVGSWRMSTRSLRCVCLGSFLGRLLIRGSFSLRFVQRCVGPSVTDEAQCQGLTDERHQQSKKMRDDRDARIIVACISGE